MGAADRTVISRRSYINADYKQTRKDIQTCRLKFAYGAMAQRSAPFTTLVAADERRARNGRFIEELGYYNPIVAADAEPILVLKEDRIKYWLGVGAQPSETAAALLKKQGS